MGKGVMLELRRVTTICLQSFWTLHDNVPVIIFEKCWVNAKVRIFNRSGPHCSWSNRIFRRGSLSFDIRRSRRWWSLRSLMTLLSTFFVWFTIWSIFIIMRSCWYHVHMRLKVPRLRSRFLLLWWIVSEFRSLIWLIYKYVRASKRCTWSRSRSSAHPEMSLRLNLC
jgi:hypothetical protein